MSITDKPQFDQDKAVEAWLDRYFAARGWLIRPTTAHEERTLCLGDRHFSKGGLTYLVEYKSGLQTFYTGNIFLETISVDSRNIPGWVHTCQANYIFYAALLNQEVLIFTPPRLRLQIEFLKDRFKEVSTGKNQNDGYDTYGVIVPLEYAEKHLAEKIIHVEERF